MKERLEFVNGHLVINCNEGTTISIIVPLVVKQVEGGDLA